MEQEQRQQPPPQQRQQTQFCSIALGEKFASFDSLKDAIDRFQRENSMQLIVKDSKLLGPMAKKMPKMMELVNKDILYYRLTYACEFHGEFKPKGATREKYRTKRRGCPMRISVRLADDLVSLVVYEMYLEHNHEPIIKQLPRTPRQQMYRLSLKNSSQYLLQKLERGADGQMVETETACGSQDFDEGFSSTDVNVNSSTTNPPVSRIIGNGFKRPVTAGEVKDLDLQHLKKRKLILKNRKLELESKKLELENRKLELELKALEKKHELGEEGHSSGGNTYYVSHVVDDAKGLNESAMNNFSSSTAEVIKSLAGRGTPVQIITH